MVKGTIGGLLLSLASLVHASPFTDNPLYCLMVNIYHEARGEPIKGQMAVASVVMNRVAHSRFPNSVCDVVYQRKQFSWTLDTHKLRMTPKFDYQIYRVALMALKGHLIDYTGGATHFHTTAINPYWTSNKVYLTTIGNHVFYKRS
jgi:N-acetylmuramoyl-L-alanine amidase